MFERRARSDARALSKQIAMSSLQGEPFSRFKKSDPALSKQFWAFGDVVDVALIFECRS